MENVISQFKEKKPEGNLGEAFKESVLEKAENKALFDDNGPTKESEDEDEASVSSEELRSTAPKMQVAPFEDTSAKKGDTTMANKEIDESMAELLREWTFL